MFPSAAALDDALRVLRAVAADAEPFELIPDQAAHLAEQLAQAVHTATAALTIVVDRAAESSRWRATGSRSVADWVSRRTGLGYGDSSSIVDASRRLAANPGATLAHLRSGATSALAAAATLTARDAAADRHRRDAERAAEASRRAAERPDEAPVDLFDEPSATECSDTPHEPQGRSAADIEADLLRLTEEGNLTRVREEARRQRAAAADAEARLRSQWLNRGWREQSFDDGSLGGTYRLPPEHAALVNATIRAEADRIARAAQRVGDGRLPYAAYLADAICQLLGIAPPPLEPPLQSAAAASAAAPTSAPSTVTPTSGSSPAAAPAVIPAGQAAPTAATMAPRPQPKIKARVDANALLRGLTAPGERCEIDGAGPISVPSAQHLLGHSSLFLVVHDDHRVRSVTHLGRRRPRGTPVHLLASGQAPPVRIRGILRVHLRDLAPIPGAPNTSLGGIGLVSLAALERLLGPKLAARAHQLAVDVQHVSSDSRDFPLEVRIAVEEDQPVCVDCGSRFNLEHDHNTAHALGGPSSLANDGHRCRADHRTKTIREASQTIRAGRLRRRSQAQSPAG